MPLFRASAITTVVLAVLCTAALTWFGHWYASYDMGDIIERVLLWFPVTLVAAAPVCLVIFPVLHSLLGRRKPVRPLTFAWVGAATLGIIAAVLIWRFRDLVSGVGFIAIPLFVVLGVLAGFIGGFLFEALVRVRGARETG